MSRHSSDEGENSPLDLAARAAWMSFVGGLTQDQIAQDLGISRQRAQRLVSRAAAEGLIHVRIDHPVAACLELERRLTARYGLAHVRVAPWPGGSGDALYGLAPFAAPIVEQLFAPREAQTIALGTGRTLRAAVEHMQSLDGARHKLVSLIGNVAPDGSASFYEVIMRLAEKTSAPHYPMAIPVIAQSVDEVELYHSLRHVRATRALAMTADIALVGLGQMGEGAPLRADGFITAEEHDGLQAAGAVGEICGHIFDARGQFIDHPVCRRVVGVRVPVNDIPVLCLAAGADKVPALRAALAGGLITSLVTDEISANSLLTD